METVLECKNLSKMFDSSVALSGVNINVARGKITGLLGPNGSGKTTLIKIAAGLLSPSSGEILINGTPPNETTKAVVSYLPDKVFLPQWMKVSALIEMYADFFTDFDKGKAYEMLLRLKIHDSSKLKAMSKGTVEKVQLVLAMSRNAELYLLDEPIGGVDPATRDFILNTIISNYNENSAVLISTHLISDIENTLDDVIFINNGLVELTSSVDEIREKNGKSVDGLFREVFKC